MTTANILSQLGSPGVSTGFKNRIINGAMVIDQRNAGASVTPTDGSFALDRWKLALYQASKLTCQQNAGSVTPPVGFTNYLGITSSSAYSIVTGDVFAVFQRIEGYNVADLGWGTANAKTVTLSFQVYSSLTGTFGGSIMNSANNRAYPFTYTISSANTWTTISITIAGDTTGTWLTTNGNGLQLSFGLGVGATYSGTAGSWSGNQYFSATGAVSVVGTNGATFYITGVQLELGVSATSFDYRAYGQELALCQRYYYSAVPLNSGSSYLVPAYAGSTALGIALFSFPVTMRLAPALVATSGTNYYDFYLANVDHYATSLTLNSPNVNYASVYATISGATAGQAGLLYIGSNSASINFNAEL